MKIKGNKYLSTKLAGYVGFTVQAIVNNFLPILFIVFQDIYSLNYEQLGRLMVFNFATQMFVDFITPKIVSYLGYRKTVVLSQFLASLGLALLAVLPNLITNTYLAIVICIVIYATGSGLTEVVLSPIIEMLPTRSKTGNMAVLHSFYCWGHAFTIIVTTLLIIALGYKNWVIIPLLWALIPFFNMFAFLKVPIIEPNPEEKQDTLFELLKTKYFIVYMAMMLFAGVSEITMADWASIFAQKALGVSKFVGDFAGPCAFALLMGFGRVTYAYFTKKVSFTKLLIFLNSLCFVCYLTVAVCKIPVIALIGCALCGLSVSISWPGLYSAGARTYKRGGAVMFSAFAMCGDTGCALGPWIVGALADKYSLNLGFGVVSIFPLLLVLCAIYILKTRSCKS